MKIKELFKFINLMIIFILISLLLLKVDLLYILIFWYFFILTNLIFKKYYYIILLFFTLYNTTAYLAANFNYIYFNISFDIIKNQTRLVFIGLLMMTIFFEILFNHKYKYRLKTNINRFKYQIKNISFIRLFIILVVFLILGTINWINIFQIGLLNIFNGYRNQYSDKVIFAYNLYYQIIIIPFSLTILIKIIEEKKYKIKFMFFLFFTYVWLPMLILGSRQKLFIVFLGFFIVYYNKKIIKYIFISIGTLFLILPFLRSNQTNFYSKILLSLHEFILPQYTLFLIKDYGREFFSRIPSYIEGVWFMFPGFLRPIDISAFGKTLKSYELTGNVGLGSNLFSEGYYNFGIIGYWILSIIVPILFKIIFFISDYFPSILVIGLPYLLLLGRGDFWITIFYIVYTNIFYLLLVSVFSSSKY